MYLIFEDMYVDVTFIIPQNVLNSQPLYAYLNTVEGNSRKANSMAAGFNSRQFLSLICKKQNQTPRP